MRDFPITDFGAAADGSGDDRAAIQRAVDAAHAAGGGRVVIPRGRCARAGSFELKSGVELRVEEGAVLRSATEIEAFPHQVFQTGAETDKRVWIRARHARDISLSGSGTIDGQCRAFALGETETIFSPTLPWRPAMTCFEDVEGLRIRGLTFRDSANWTLHFVGCRDVAVSDVRVFNNLKFPNADGIDPDHCRRVRIQRCHIVSADDCICLKNTADFRHYGPCEDIEITDCRLESASAAFKIGSETHGDFRRVRMRDCVIERSHRGLAVQLRHGGTVEDVVFERVRVETRHFAPDFWGGAEPVCLTALPGAGASQPGRIRDVVFSDIACRGESGIVIYADPPESIQGVRFEKMSLEIVPGPEPGRDILDLRPFPPGYVPRGGFEPASDPTPWGHTLHRPAAAWFEIGGKDLETADIEWILPPAATAVWKDRRG